MSETPTSYSLLVMFKDVIYAVRDPYGNRPLCIGRLVPISKLHSSGIVSFANDNIKRHQKILTELFVCHRSHLISSGVACVGCWMIN